MVSGHNNDKKSKIQESINTLESQSTVTVELTVDKVKKKSNLGINRKITRVQSEEDAIKQLNSQEDQTYFASFDATALSTAWVQLGGISKEHEEKMIEIEKSKKMRELGYVPESSSTFATIDPKFSHIDRTELPGDISNLFKRANQIPNFTAEDVQTYASLVSTYLHEQNIWQRLDPTNAVQHLQQPLPLFMWLLCDCPLDAHLTQAMEYIGFIIRKRNWSRLFHFVYIPKAAQEKFDLAKVYELDEQLITIGTCTKETCPDNRKVVRYTFPMELSTVPKDLTVALYNECCGDKFELDLHDITTRGFVLHVKRVDPNTQGWGQVLRARWVMKSNTRVTYTPPGGVPALLLDNLPMGIHTEKYKFTPRVPYWDMRLESVNITAQDVVGFLEHFLLGDLQPIIRSETPPMVQSLPPPIYDIVGSTFNEYVLDPANDALVFIYSPFCPASRAVMILLQSQIATMLRTHNVQNLRILKIDKIHNDIPYPGIAITRLPMILFFPGGDPKHPKYQVLDYSDYNGTKQPHNPMIPHSHYTKELILKFLYDHTKVTNWNTLGKIIEGYKSALYTDPHNHHHHGHNHNH